MKLEKKLAKAKEKLKKQQRKVELLEAQKSGNEAVEICYDMLNAIHYGTKEFLKHEQKDTTSVKEFKVGDFIANYSKHFGIITELEIGSNGGLGYYYDGFGAFGDYVENGFYYINNSRRHPTEEQVLEHLIKVAEIKGLVKGTKFKSVLNVDNIGEIKTFYIPKTTGDLCSDDIVVWRKHTNKWAEPIKVDFSILNDEDVFYLKTECGYKYLFKGEDPFNPNVDFFDLDFKLIGFGKLCEKDEVAELRKANKEQQELFNSKFPKYKVSGVVSENKYCISDNKETKVFVYGNKQLAEDICEFLNNKK